MIGTMAGDIIASPYVNNPREKTSDIFFPLFTASEKVTVNGRTVRSRTYQPQDGVCSALAKAATEWYVSGDHSLEAWNASKEKFLEGRHPSGTEVLAVCGPIVRMADNLDEALRMSALAVSDLKPRGEVVSASADFTVLLWAMRSPAREEEIARARRRLEDSGYDLHRNSSEIRPFLDGTVIEAEAGKLTMGDGKVHSEPKDVIPGVWAVLSESRSFEEAVRRAVALGGNPVVNATLVGAAAEQRWDIPEEIRKNTEKFLSAQDRTLLNKYDRFLKAKAEGESFKQSRAEANGTKFSVIRLEGLGSIYVIPEGRKDIEDAVKKANKAAGKSEKAGDYVIIRPEELESVVTRLSEQKDESGKLLDGTYIEHPRPEVKSLWMQNGEIRTSTTRSGEGVGGAKLPSVETRKNILNDWSELKEYASKVRSDLENFIGFKSKGKDHIHFESAFYPVVLDRSIEIREGDILRAQVGIDDNGRFSVNTNVFTGGVHTEGIDGVLNTMNLLPKSAGMKEFKQVLDEYCLDYGRIEEEGERKALKDGDESEVHAIRKKYKSNVDRAYEDARIELKSAVMPEGPHLSGKAEAIRQERLAESVERYAGMTRTDVVDSQLHKGSVFTIGHSNLSQEEFDKLLKRHGIEVLVDIRSIPNSRFAKQFNKDTLDSHLMEKDIEYYHFPEFGGKQYVTEKDEKGKNVQRQMSYEEIMKTDEFKKGMKSLRDCVKGGYRVALMCSENEPLDCHRMVMMGRALAHPEVYGSKSKPIDVQHITRSGYTLSQSFMEQKMLSNYKSDNLNEVYKLRGEQLVNKAEQPKRISLRRNYENKKTSKGVRR